MHINGQHVYYMYMYDVYVIGECYFWCTTHAVHTPVINV